MSLKAKIEALLFLVDEPISTAEIAQRANVDINDVRQGLSQLMQDYEMRDTGLIIRAEDGYIIDVKDQYGDLVEEFLPISIKTGCIRTLSAIALKEPVHQSQVVKMRGGSAYEQIKELVDMELITRRKEGPSFVIRTTKLFHDYFKLSETGIELQDFLKGKSKRFKKDTEQATLNFNQEEEISEKTENADNVIANDSEAIQAVEAENETSSTDNAIASDSKATLPVETEGETAAKEESIPLLTKIGNAIFNQNKDEGLNKQVDTITEPETISEEFKEEKIEETLI